jgi:hypothetical protein
MIILKDNDDERLFMKEGFVQSGLYEIVGKVENGDEMLQLFGNHVPSNGTMLSDLDMPGQTRLSRFC